MGRGRRFEMRMTPRWDRRRPVLVVLSLTLAVLAVPAVPAGAQVAEPVPDTTPALEALLVEEAARSFGPTWGGSWRDQDGTLVLGFTTDPKGALTALRERVGAQELPVRAQPVSFSMGELRTVDDQLWALAGEARRLPNLFAWSLKPERNRLVAYTDDVETVRDQLAANDVDVDKIAFEQRQHDWDIRFIAGTGCVSPS